MHDYNISHVSTQYMHHTDMSTWIIRKCFLKVAHVAVAVAAWRGERDRPPDLYQPGGETRESPPCQVLTGVE